MHEIIIDELHITCSCEDFETEVTDKKFIKAVASRHLMQNGIWPKVKTQNENDDENETEKDD